MAQDPENLQAPLKEGLDAARAARRRQRLLEKVAQEALAIEREEAREAGELGYMARILVQCTMPHRDPKGPLFRRSNGHFELTMMAPRGLPFGKIPRLLLAWTTTEAVRTKNRTLQLGDTLSGFMGQLGLIPTGGRWGSITRLRSQAKRLYSSTISAILNDERRGEWEEQGFRLADSTSLWWDPRSPDQIALYGSTVTLTQDFFESITRRPVPVDMRALKVLRSPLALDLYTWLTYRFSYLRHETEIPWEALELQFGADYKETRAFKFRFLQRLRDVLKLYPSARVAEGSSGLILKPSPTHVAKLTAPRS